MTVKIVDGKGALQTTLGVNEGTNMIGINFKKFVYFVFGGFGKICFSLMKIILLKR